MGIEEVVQVNITAETQTVSRAGFGVPLALIYHTEYVDRVREYSTLTAAEADGLDAGTPGWRLLAKLFSQNPHVSKVKVGRRALPPTNKYRFIPLSTTVGLVYSVTITRPNGIASTFTYTVQPSDTVALIIDGLIAAFNAVSPAITMTETDNTTNFDLVADVAGELFDIAVSNELSIENTTVDPGIATDLAAVRAADDEWYGLAIDSNSKAELLAAAAWTEPSGKLFGTDSSDTAVKNGTTGNAFETAKGFGYVNSFGIFGGSSLSYAGAGWLGRILPFDPGAATAALKTIAGVQPTSLTDTQKAAIAGDGETLGDGGNHYTTLGGQNVTRWGRTFGGQFIDITRDIAFLQARLKEDVYAKLVSLPKIPMTNGGISIITGTMLARLNSAVDAGILSKDSPPTVTAPDVKDISAIERGNRVLPDIIFTGTLAGAIHKVVPVVGRLAI